MADEKEREIKRLLTTLGAQDNKVLESNVNRTTVAEISISENVFVESTKQDVGIAQIEPLENDSSLPHVNCPDSKLCIDETDSLECTVPLDLSELSEGDTNNCEASVETILPLLEVQNIHSCNQPTENTVESKQVTDSLVRYFKGY